MNDFDRVVRRYLAAWNATDEADRRKLIDEVFAEDVRYVDPLAAVAGREALSGLIGAVHQQFPGLVFTAGGPADAHHDQGRFTGTWVRRAVNRWWSASTWRRSTRPDGSGRCSASSTRCRPEAGGREPGG